MQGAHYAPSPFAALVSWRENFGPGEPCPYKGRRIIGNSVGKLLIPSSVADATISIVNLLIIRFLLTEDRKPKTENGIN